MNKFLLALVGSVVIIIGLVYVVPPKLLWQQSRSITVTGVATSEKTNEVANFSAGVSAVNDKKEVAMSEVSEKVKKLTDSIKSFGIPEKDIKTQNMNIYQTQESYYEGGSQKQRLGQWNVSINVEIKLRDMTKITDFTKLLSESGSNNVYGPNLTLDTESQNGDELTGAAIDNARSKAENIAKSSKAKLGKVLNVVEGTSGGGIIPFAARVEGGGGGMPVEVGTTSVSKSVTVTFELR